MTKRREALPEWAEQERADDLALIGENLDVFWPAAQLAYQTVGRGAIVVDTTTQPTGAGHSFDYLDQAAIESFGFEDTQRLVREYDPDNELVAALIKTEERISSYRMRMVPGELGEEVSGQVEPGRPEEPEIDPEPPDLETLMAWEAEGGCEATDGCWVEADGVCSHGCQSWLLELGLI